jgi:hypothetical protein
MDESGDLGFNFSKQKTSKYFVVTFLFTNDKNALDKIVKSVFKKFTRKQIETHNGVLHAYKETEATRMQCLQMFRDAHAGKVITIYLNKNKVYTKLQDEKQVLYNYVTNILLDRVFTKSLIPTDQKICLVASRRETNKFLNQNFSNYIVSQAKGNHKLDIDVAIRTPQNEKGLQLVDVISWAIFRKYEHGEVSYYNEIKDTIVEENSLFA